MNVKESGGADAVHSPEHPGIRRDRLRQDHSTERAHRIVARRRAHRRHRGHPGTSHRALQLRPLRGSRTLNRSGNDQGFSPSRACVTARITSWWARCAAGRPRTCCKPSTPDTAARSPPYTPTTPNRPCHGSPVAPCRAAGELPWEVTCRGVVDGIAMVIHMTRSDGRRFVEEAALRQRLRGKGE